MPTELRRIPSLPEPAHYADDEGHIWAERDGVVQLLKERVLKNGYLAVSVRVCVKDSIRNVHVLVAEAFLGPRPPGQVVRHVDGDKLVNRPSSLEYGTHQANAADARRHGTARYGENHPNAKLTAENVVGVRFALQMGVARKAIAQELGVSLSAIHDIAQKRRWRAEPTAAVAAVAP
ncbi:HNH endonuclease signature motif containing protein [Urbifossiella limnaea]|uniref:HNH nuclease domain-containing protein n=1 Tax=Urbifossiella limnaea TaxID=2528023 RepID=A0A517XLX8_9BACT|nr:HNH endonuclease signature motif containing protein [Urbifossiella limnaea]QDU18476.1 hypothetical protein ETAA1_03640 [Urbifossiella limnaea]